VAFGLRLNRFKGDMEERVATALQRAALWNEVKDKLKNSGLSLSGGQQQRLCIARAIATEPDVLLMDEPCSALDPKGTEAVEELIWELRGKYTILIVTHNMAQARRASEECIFMLMGKVVEHTATEEMFVTPKKQETANYIEGRYG
jgi:phosphate transport system ATP-binding protein